jgi:hypothetical protein
VEQSAEWSAWEVFHRTDFDVAFGFRAALQQAAGIWKKRSVKEVDVNARLFRCDHADVTADGAARVSGLEVTESMEFDGFVHRGCGAENELAQFQDRAAKLIRDTSEEICQLLFCQSSPHGCDRLIVL